MLDTDAVNTSGQGWHHNALERLVNDLFPFNLSHFTSEIARPRSTSSSVHSVSQRKAKHRALLGFDAIEFTKRLVHPLLRCPCVIKFQASTSLTDTG